MAMLQAADLSNKELKSYEDSQLDQSLRKQQEKNDHLLLKMYFFLYLQMIELWDPAYCQSLHV